jgi:hypothetical protein
MVQAECMLAQLDVEVAADGPGDVEIILLEHARASMSAWPSVN